MQGLAMACDSSRHGAVEAVDPTQSALHQIVRLADAKQVPGPLLRQQRAHGFGHGIPVGFCLAEAVADPESVAAKFRDLVSRPATQLAVNAAMDDPVKRLGTLHTELVESLPAA